MRVLGRSPQIERVQALIERLAASNTPVLLEGETGTGKEKVAEAIHEASARKDGPFVVFDCTAVPPSLAEAQLFGHDKGAFTGAATARMGVFEEAHGGTLLIDEIGDLDPKLQPKLLRVVERGELRRLGEAKSTQVDVRLMFATRRNLEVEVREGRFRDDLFHRIAVTRVTLPPLRDRAGDVRFLATRFAEELGATLDESVMARWERMMWPGNVRELRNAVARRVALGDLADDADLAPMSELPPLSEAPVSSVPELPGMPELVDRLMASNVRFDDARKYLVAAFEREFVMRALERHEGVVSHAAEAFGIARRHFHRLLARHRH